MSIPMPLYERFAPGTQWALTVPSAGLPAGTRVRVEEGPDEDVMVTVSPVEWEGQCVRVNVGVLG